MSTSAPGLRDDVFRRITRRLVPRSVNDGVLRSRTTTTKEDLPSAG